MQHLKLLSLTVLVFGCAFHVGGFPAGGDAPKSTGYFGYAKNLASRGYGLVGSGMTSDYAKNLASSGVEMIGNGLYAGAGMLANAPGSQFTLDRLSRALSSVNPQSLARALGIPNVSSAITSKVDLYGILEKLFMGQVQPVTGGMNYEATTIFLERLAVTVPSLKKTVEAFKTVNYVMNKARTLRSQGQPIDATTLMREAIDMYFMDVDPAFKKKLIALSPLVYDAAFGDRNAAWKVADALADRDTVIQALRGMGYKAQIEIIEKVIRQVSEFATLLKGR